MSFWIAFWFCVACEQTVSYLSPRQRRSDKSSEVDEHSRIKCRHILIQYKGASNTDPMLERSREEAIRLPIDFFLELQTGADFGALARAHGDGPSASYGGELKPNHKGGLISTLKQRHLG